MNKYERIKFVKDIGLNTEENMLINPNTHPADYLNFLNRFNECSIRTFKENELKTPHYPIIDKTDAIKRIKDLQRLNYNIILATPINPKDCEFAGAALQSESQLVIEIAYGPGTVRRVTHDNQIDKRYILGKNEMTDNNKINMCVRKFRDTKLENVIFEFSWYNKPIGWRHENFICWEITDDGTKQSIIK